MKKLFQIAIAQNNSELSTLAEQKYLKPTEERLSRPIFIDVW